MVETRRYLMEHAVHDDLTAVRSQQLTRQIGAGSKPRGVSWQSIQSRGSLQNDFLRRAMRYVSEHLDSKLKWDDLATEVGLEAFAFARRFKLATGVTPHQYIIHCRLNRALQLLSQSERRLADIALEVGCSSQSYLTALFRKYLDTTPGAYRLSCVGRTASGPPAVGRRATQLARISASSEHASTKGAEPNAG